MDPRFRGGDGESGSDRGEADFTEIVADFRTKRAGARTTRAVRMIYPPEETEVIP